MSRYIDADNLHNAKFQNTDGYGENVAYRVGWNEAIEAIEENEPTAIDIVRCGECRKVREDGGHANCNGYLYCRKWKTLVDEDGYCSWGEREGE